MAPCSPLSLQWLSNKDVIFLLIGDVVKHIQYIHTMTECFKAADGD